MRNQQAWVLAALEEFELPLFRYALRLLVDEASARDCVQHALLRLCDESPQQHLAGPARWLFAVVRNRALDLLRVRGREQSFDEEPAALAACCVGEIDPARQFERADTLGAVRRLIEQLPPSQQEIVQLWSEGLSYADIAEITGKSAGNLRVLIHRLLDRLRQHPSLASFHTDGPRTQPSV